jgi:hypothetical protein
MLLHEDLDSQCLQKSDHIRISVPAFNPSVSGYIAFCQGFGLHLKIHFGVDVGSVERYVSEPASDSIDIDSIAEQVNGAGMPAISPER